MPLLAQICMVVVTIAVIGMAAMAIRVMLQTRELLLTANRSLAELPKLIDRATRTSEKADELLAAFSRITRSAGAGAAQIEGLATRTTSIASMLLDEVEAPLSQAVGVMRGVRTGLKHFVGLWKTRATARSSGPAPADAESEGRWLDDGGVPPPARTGAAGHGPASELENSGTRRP